MGVKMNFVVSIVALVIAIVGCLPSKTASDKILPCRSHRIIQMFDSPPPNLLYLPEFAARVKLPSLATAIDMVNDITRIVFINGSHKTVHGIG